MKGLILASSTCAIVTGIVAAGLSYWTNNLVIPPVMVVVVITNAWIIYETVRK